jgi:hypothetical protein
LPDPPGNNTATAAGFCFSGALSKNDCVTPSRVGSVTNSSAAAAEVMANNAARVTAETEIFTGFPRESSKERL